MHCWKEVPRMREVREGSKIVEVTSFHSIQDDGSLLVLVTHGPEVPLHKSLTPAHSPPMGVVYLFRIKASGHRTKSLVVSVSTTSLPAC